MFLKWLNVSGKEVIDKPTSTSCAEEQCEDQLSVWEAFSHLSDINMV